VSQADDAVRRIIEFPSRSDADDALRNLSNTELKGNVVTVEEAVRPPSPIPRARS
jgi:RNA recognition motif-containing protein